MLAVGFDYGTSHCSLGLAQAGQVRLAPLDGGATLITSNLYAPKLQLGLRIDKDGLLDAATQSYANLRFGDAALQAYLDDPSKGYYVKSPKSFLGAPGLNEDVKERFVTVVAAMMLNVRSQAEAYFDSPVEQVVIGRPVNFQGPGGSDENSQALAMLDQAARCAGFVEINFLYEPMAAALEYEARLNADQAVLVVDVGGGTTDCSFVRVGPQRRAADDRSADILGHSGERIGGNDYDQTLALQSVMPLFGFGDTLTTGLPIPNHYFVDAVSTNVVPAQQRFYSKTTGERLSYFVKESLASERVARLARLHEQRGSYRLLRHVEMSKIDLSDQSQSQVGLDFVEPELSAATDRHTFGQACERLLGHLEKLVSEVLTQSGHTPDVVYLTGGMARSPVVRAHLDRLLKNVPKLDSDHFASVTEGLSIWAERIYGTPSKNRPRHF